MRKKKMRGGRGGEEGDDGEEERQTHLRILMIYAPQSPRVQKQLVERAAVHAVRVCRDRRLVREHDLARDGGVDCEQPPVHESAIAQVRVVDLLRRPLEDFVHELLRPVRRGLVHEKFDDRCQERKLDLDELISTPSLHST